MSGQAWAIGPRNILAALPMALAVHAAVLQRAPAVADNACIDIDNANPSSSRFGFPSWRTSDNSNCRPKFSLDDDGECFSHLNPSNECNSFCQVSSTWHYGKPIDLMHGEVCEVGDDCARSFNYQEGLSKTASNELSNTYGETETNSVTTKLGFSLGLKLPLGKFDILGGGMPLSTDLITGATPAGIPLGGPLRARALDLGMTLDISHAWSMAVNKGHTFGVGNSTQWSITIGVTENLSKPAYAKNYCGGWFGVPIMGLSCGRGAHGTLKQSSRDSYQCALEPGTATFGHCFDYTFIDPVKANQTRYRMVYVLRDCQHGYILPGEWQHPAFAQSFWAGDYVSEHIMRFGYQNLPATSKKPHDDSWIEQRHAFEFTRQLGPEDHTIEVCGRGNYCARHKSTPGNCYNFPRGYAGSKAAYLVSAKTTRGNCCVLFSRPECHGIAQVVKGNLTAGDMAAAGFEGHAHSMVCNLDEYCNPNRFEAAAA